MPLATRAFILAMGIVVVQNAFGQALRQGETKAKAVAVVMLDIDLGGVEGFGQESGVLLTELLAIELARRDGVNVLERDRFNDLLEEDALRLSGRISGRHASDLREPAGRLGAQVLVSGKGFSYKDQLIISVNLTEIETGFTRAILYQGPIQKKISDVAGELGTQILDTLVTQTVVGSIESPPPPSQPDPHASQSVESRTGLLRVCVFIEETFLAEPSPRSLVQSRMKASLFDQGFNVSEPNHSLAGWPQNAAEGADTVLPVRLREGLKDVDIAIIGQASTQPGIRTGDLISAQARLKIGAYSVRTGIRLQSLELSSKALDASVESAARSALRRVAQDSIEVLLPTLVEAIP